MSKKSNKPSRRQKKGDAFPDSSATITATKNSSVSVVDNSRRWFLITVFLIVALGGTYLAQAMRGGDPNVKRYGFKLIKKHPHDKGAFTQGLVLEGNTVYESTGKYNGESSIRKVDLESGKIIKQVSLPDDQFGEGLAKVGNKLYQLTWKAGICHVYDKDLNKTGEFKYSSQGWGLCYDGDKYLIMSDGTSRLYFLDPETFEEVKTITVRNGVQYIDSLNELEFTGGKIYANRWKWDSVYQIDPETGKVLGIIDLKSIWPRTQRPDEGVLNGIAVNIQGKTVVTGKYCPYIYEIELTRASGQ